MTLAHTVEYSKSARAKCHGDLPCKGSSIGLGCLRYGETIAGEYGETVQWRHWGCVTPGILRNMSAASLNRVHGFSSLKSEDQAKVRKAMASGRVDPSDIPETARTPGFDGAVAPNQVQKKRKAAYDEPGTSSRPSTSSQSTQAHHAESTEIIDLTEEEVRDEMYCALSSKVVGIQYYKGLVGPGEEVTLVREPRNQYDRNAIQVKNIGGTQVGHVPRDIASKLAPLMDRHLITVEGFMNEGNLTGFTYALSVTLKIFGPSDKRDTLEPLLVWATPRQRGFPPRNGSTTYEVPGLTDRKGSSTSAASMVAGAAGSSSRRQSHMTPAQVEAVRKQQEALQKAAELKQMLSSLEKVDDEGRRTSLLDTLCSSGDILNLPVHPDPPGTKNGNLVVNLLKHQSQALQWCIEREYPVLPKTETDKPVQFWQIKKSGAKTYYYNLATKSPQVTAPVLGRGAMCADSMGLGKTLTMLALILATKGDNQPEFSRSTLIVVPLSVLSNWEKQIEEHCTRGALSSCVYYGASRSMTPQDLQKFDVVITTYQTITGQHMDPNDGNVKKKKKIERSLFEVQWKRIILDEGHTIRNPKTKMAKAVCALIAQRRWVLSGTPIINSPRDLGSLLTFLQICRPLDNEDFFKRLLLRPLKDSDPAGAELLRALMNSICIRRTKEMKDKDGKPLIPLPPVEMILVPVTLTEEARALYDTVEQFSKKRFERYMSGAHGNSFLQANVLSMLTRMRQLALHTGLVPANYLAQLRETDENDNAPAVQLSAQDKLRLQDILLQAIEDSEECPICFSVLTDPRITNCAHAFCLGCIMEVISRDPKCPMDRRPLTVKDLVEPPPPTELTQARILPKEDEDTSGLGGGSSAKIDQLIHLLKLTPPTEKALVFSQFTTFLDKIAEALEEEGIPHVRLDGRMSAKKRQDAIERFSIPLEDNDASIQDESPTLTSRSCSSKTHSRVDSDDEVGASGVDDSDEDFIDDGDVDDDDAFVSATQKQKGKGKAKATTKGKSAKGKAAFDRSAFSGENPKVMLLSLKCGSLGLNLTVANNVYLMDPWWQEGIESQAIDRCNRIGQKKPVHVYQLIADNTVESKVIEIQERKKLLVQQAFSGTKGIESHRQKKEARLQDLIELFGIRRQEASQGR